MRSAIGAFTVFGLLLTFSVNAASVQINHAVPTMQQYVALPAKNKTSSTSYASVILTKKDPVAVTFSVRALKSNGTWGNYSSGTVVRKTGVSYNVPYEYQLGAGTQVQARFRNHNWSLNSNQIEGTFDYK